MKFFFPDFDYQKWLKTDEEIYRTQSVKFNEEKIEHEIIGEYK